VRVRISHKLLAGFLIVGLLPVALGVLFFSRQLASYEAVSAGRIARVDAQRAADRLQLRVSAILDALEFARRRLHVEAADQDILQWAYDQHPELLKLTVADDQGRTIASLFRFGYTPQGEPVPDLAADAGRAGSITFSQWNLEPQLELYLPVIDLASGERKGTLHAEVSLKGLFAELPGDVADGGTLYILDQQGRVVSHPDISQVLEARDMSTLEVVRVLQRGDRMAHAEYVDTGGKDVLGTGVKVPDLPLYIIKELPVEQAFALSRDLSRGLYMVFGIAALLLLVMAVFVTRAITRPLERLEHGTRRVAKGELNFTLSETRQLLPDELGDLAVRFNAMVEALQTDKRSREEAEKELLKLRNYLSNIIDSMPSILVGVDAKARVTQWNLEAEKRTGIASSQAIGKTLSDLLPQLAREMDKVHQAIRERRAISDDKVAFKREEGELAYSDITIYPLITNGVEGAVIRVDDVTERVRIEEMMIQSEKMLMVGGLAAGMAHEINNPLAGILQNIQVMRNRMQEGLEQNRRVAEECGVDMTDIGCYMERRGLLAMIEAVLESGARASHIVTNMLNFSRKSDVGIEPQDTAALLDRTLELAANDYDLKKRYDFRRIEIQRDYDPDLPLVPCDATKLQQVVLNLLKNGAQAMMERGDADQPHRFIIRTRQNGNWAQIDIEDNGPGMDEAVSKRIFEPFFTTKGVGSGTGLGLSVSYFIIHENHSGTLTVASEPGAGSCFVIRLPLQQGEV